jgi:serine/threonine protein kinase
MDDQPLGTSEFGEVWKVCGPDGVVGALKQVASSTSPRETVERFRREVENLHRISVNTPHRGIVRVLDVGGVDEAGCGWCVMEFAGVSTLQSWMLANPKVEQRSVTTILSILSQIAAALESLHGAEVQVGHRSLQPSNLMCIEEDGETAGEPNCRIVLIDFGLARWPGTRYARKGASGLDIRYAAPEALLSIVGTNETVDLYSLGLIALDLSTNYLTDRSAAGNVDYYRTQRFRSVDNWADVPLERIDPAIARLMRALLVAAPTSRASAKHICELIKPYLTQSSENAKSTFAAPSVPKRESIETNVVEHERAGSGWAAARYLPMEKALADESSPLVHRLNRIVLPLLNERFMPHAYAYRFSAREPRITNTGPKRFPNDISSFAAALRQEGRIRLNDPHAFLGKEEHLRRLVRESTELTFHCGDYADILAHQRMDTPMPPILSASAILVSERGRLILHLRSSDSRTYKRCLHTIGGALQPRLPMGAPSVFDTSLFLCACREAFEETLNLPSIPAEGPSPLLVSREIPTNFVQFVFLGLSLSAGDDFHETHEGKPIAFDVRSIEDTLRNFEVVPSGAMHVLAWLAAGAPGAAGAAGAISSAEAQSVFFQILAEGDDGLLFGDPTRSD